MHYYYILSTVLFHSACLIESTETRLTPVAGHRRWVMINPSTVVIVYYSA